MTAREARLNALVTVDQEWLHGWDTTPGIVSVWADGRGRASVWRRDPERGLLLREQASFTPWLLLDSLRWLEHLGSRLRPHPEPPAPGGASFEELEGPGALRFIVRAFALQPLCDAVLQGASRLQGRAVRHVRELGADVLLLLPPEEQYLVGSGRTYFKGLVYDDLRRLQLDLETTGLDPDVERVFLVALRSPEGKCETLRAESDSDAAEAALLSRVASRVRELDPDVIENHNLHGFDLPFIMRRAELLRSSLWLGRGEPEPARLRPSSRGARLGQPGLRWTERLKRARYAIAGRELLDSMDAVRRYDFAARELQGHGLKVVARHFGLARSDREHIAGELVYETFQRDPERVARYAEHDVEEAAAVARLLGGAAFSLSQMVPRRYERLADAGAATGMLEPLMVRAYLRAGAALPGHERGGGTPHQGAQLYLFASGVARRVVKADVASLYPSLMRQYRIGPSRDRLGVFLHVVERLVERRLSAKAEAKTAPSGSNERFQLEAESAAIKLVVNSAYGYLGAVGLTRFSDVHAANEITAKGRELLSFMCRELGARGVQLLEADTDGVYFAMSSAHTERDEARVVAEVAALLPPLVELQLEGRYAAMLSHEPKNYALLPYDGPVVLRGVAFRSSRAEPMGERFLRHAVERLLRGDVLGVRAELVATVRALRQRTLGTLELCSRVRLTKTPEQYRSARAQRRELPYEALLEAGRDDWAVGETVHVYRRQQGRAGLWSPLEGAPDPRDYDVELYVRILRENFATRLARGLAPDDFEAVAADPDRPSLFQRDLLGAQPILTVLAEP